MIIQETRIYPHLDPAATPVNRRAISRFSVGEVRAMQTTAQIIVSGVAGYFVVPKFVAIRKVIADAFGGIANGENLEVRTKDAAGTLWITIEPDGFMDQATAQARFHAANNLDLTTPDAAEGLVLLHATGDGWTGGGADANAEAIRVYCEYALVQEVF